VKNIDKKTVESFGDEWNQYNQSSLAETELEKAWDQYFHIFPFDQIDLSSEGFDMGCGSGRWAKFVAPKVKLLNCIDPSSKALNVAKKNLGNFSNINFYEGSANHNDLTPESQDFGYSLGVLHHIPDTLEGIKGCAELLKKDAPFLLYLYYDLENRSSTFILLWKLSDILRKFICILPHQIKLILTFLIAIFVYFPLARIALIAEKLKVNVSQFPLTDYRHKNFYFMQTDALDRFGTRLEHRFNQQEIRKMLKEAGFKNITFSEKLPFWVCISYKSL
jgi:ubiquinone/menaquinone biosynthesis C-methylase UbiE